MSSAPDAVKRHSVGPSTNEPPPATTPDAAQAIAAALLDFVVLASGPSGPSARPLMPKAGTGLPSPVRRHTPTSGKGTPSAGKSAKPPRRRWPVGPSMQTLVAVPEYSRGEVCGIATAPPTPNVTS